MKQKNIIRSHIIGELNPDFKKSIKETFTKLSRNFKTKLTNYNPKSLFKNGNLALNNHVNCRVLAKYLEISEIQRECENVENLCKDNIQTVYKFMLQTSGYIKAHLLIIKAQEPLNGL